jgi:hypothetical protein
MANHQIHQRHLPTPTPNQNTPKPTPKPYNPQHLKPPRPASPPRPPRIKRLAYQEPIRVDVEVEPAESHNDVKELVLNGNEEGGEAVEDEGTFVVGGPEGFEEDGRDGEEGDVFDVGVV